MATFLIKHTRSPGESMASATMIVSIPQREIKLIRVKRGKPAEKKIPVDKVVPTKSDALDVVIKIYPEGKEKTFQFGNQKERDQFYDLVLPYSYSAVQIADSKIKASSGSGKGLSGPGIPPLCAACLSRLQESDALQMEGIFRVAPDADELEKVMQSFSSGQLDSLKNYSPHTAAAALKRFLRQLENPIIPYESYDQFISIGKHDAASRPGSLKKLVESLPESNRALLTAIFPFLHTVASNVATNKMNTTNLAVVFGPCIAWSQDPLTSAQNALRNNDLAQIMIEHHATIFPPLSQVIPLNIPLGAPPPMLSSMGGPSFVASTPRPPPTLSALHVARPASPGPFPSAPAAGPPFVPPPQPQPPPPTPPPQPQPPPFGSHPPSGGSGPHLPHLPHFPHMSQFASVLQHHHHHLHHHTDPHPMPPHHGGMPVPPSSPPVPPSSPPVPPPASPPMAPPMASPAPPSAPPPGPVPPSAPMPPPTPPIGGPTLITPTPLVPPPGRFQLPGMGGAVPPRSPSPAIPDSSRPKTPGPPPSGPYPPSSPAHPPAAPPPSSPSSSLVAPSSPGLFVPPKFPLPSPRPPPADDSGPKPFKPFRFQSPDASPKKFGRDDDASPSPGSFGFPSASSAPYVSPFVSSHDHDRDPHLQAEIAKVRAEFDAILQAEIDKIRKEYEARLQQAEADNRKLLQRESTIYLP